jgi:hypothetical protein
MMEPGLNVKLPKPIQTVQRLDNRIYASAPAPKPEEGEELLGLVGLK